MTRVKFGEHVMQVGTWIDTAAAAVFDNGVEEGTELVVVPSHVPLLHLAVNSTALRSIETSKGSGIDDPSGLRPNTRRLVGTRMPENSLYYIMCRRTSARNFHVIIVAFE